MAPYPISDEITDLNLSSLQLDSQTTTLKPRSLVVDAFFKRNEDTSAAYSPSETYQMLTARDLAPRSTATPNHAGAVDPNAINMKVIQALFALIGASFVIGSIWFFFWAKNGGFQWRKGDWDDYKSTVLRRKGPNGTTLSNATKSTRLGGGSVVGQGYSDEGASTIDGTMTETMTDLSSEAPIIKEKNRSKKSRAPENAKERKIREAKEAGWEGGHDQDVRAYRHERPARVGGINKDSDALHYGTDYTDTDPSVINSHRSSRQQQPRQPSSRQASPEKRASRRDFSYGNDAGFSTVSSQPEDPQPAYEPSQPPVPPHRPGRYHSPSKQPHGNDSRRSAQYNTNNSRQNVPGAYHHEPASSDIQSQHTKSYHHPIPGLNGGQQGQQGRGFRRDRRDSLDD